MVRNCFSILFIKFLFSATLIVSSGFAQSVNLHTDILPSTKKATVISKIISFSQPMNRAVLSWNALTPGTSSIKVYLRSKKSNGIWSPWFFMGHWGANIPSRSKSSTYGDIGKVDQDTLILKPGHFAREWQYKVDKMGDPQKQSPTLFAVSLAVKNQALYQKNPGVLNDVIPAIPVPTLSQFQDVDEKIFPNISARICSPTSIAMLLLREKISLPPLGEFVASVKDTEGAIPYGNWSFNVAYLFHVFKTSQPNKQFTTYVRWFESFDDILQVLKKRTPVVVSIQYKEGELSHAAQAKPTEGHLVVVTGADQQYVYVNDPASLSRENVARKYDKAEFIRAWKGIAYVIDESPPTR